MFKFIIDKLWGSTDNTINLEDAYKILTEAEDNEKCIESECVEDITLEYKIKHESGTITSYKNNIYEIDQRHKFTSETIFTVGTKVSFTIYSDGDIIKITNVKEVVDEWGSVAVAAGGQTWCLRTINVQVVSKHGRKLIADPGNIEIDLNETKSEFVPIVGDFLELETKSEVDESVINLNGKILEIIKVRPVRANLKEGYIKKFDEKLYKGVVNKDIFFNKEALLDGYIPKVGDKVVVEIIESNQYDCFWRAVKVMLQHTVAHTSINPFGNLNKLPVYEHSLVGVSISDNIVINAKRFNETHTCHITVTNERKEDIIIKKITIEGTLHQTKLQGIVKSQVLKSLDSMKFTFVVVAKSTGISREIVLFHFEECCVGRVVGIKLEACNVQPVHGTSMHINKNEQYDNFRRHMRIDQKQPIRGERPKQGPRFYGKQMKDWRIPRNLVNTFTEFDDLLEFKNKLSDALIRFKPCLGEPLTINNYEDRFHTLLYLEELHYNMCIRKYDLERACFIEDGQFLILEMPGLAENRPSVVVGDKIIATCLATETSYEGFVHNSMGNHLNLKFSGIFHSQYRGDDYRIHVVPSRSMYRRVHQSTHLASTIMPELLFPNQIYKKKPQVKFTYEQYGDILCTTDKKMKIRTAPVLSDMKQSKRISNMDLIKRMNAINLKVNNNSTGKAFKNSLSTDVNPEDNKKAEEGNKSIGTKLLLMKTNNLKALPAKFEYKLEWYDKSLNYYQKEAVRNILLGESRPLPYIIFGPPGTGKTVTIIECILQIVRMISHSRLLIATPSNSAANLLTQRLISCGTLRPGDLVRLASYKAIQDNSIPPNIMPYCALASIARDGTTSDENKVHEQGYVTDMTMAAIGRHRITIGTCHALGALQYMDFKKGHFTHVIVDEAGQCTEPEIMIPLTHVDTVDGQIILAGDPMQLGPVLLSDVVKDFGMSETYMDRLINRFPYLRDISGFPKSGGYDPRLVTKLLYNYRALPELLAIPNNCFYHNDLRATISETDSEEAAFLKTLEDMLPVVGGKMPSLVFHGINGVNQRGEDVPSWYNLDEASQVFYYMNELYRLGVLKQDIGIITPYVKQVKLIREILREAEFEIPKIGTVEEFQGLEFKVIILSTVRSGAEELTYDRKYVLGFISNPRRFNVALTRSQCLTIVIGNPNLLSLDSYWGSVLAYCRTKGTYVGCDVL